ESGAKLETEEYKFPQPRPLEERFSFRQWSSWKKIGLDALEDADVQTCRFPLTSLQFSELMPADVEVAELQNLKEIETTEAPQPSSKPGKRTAEAPLNGPPKKQQKTETTQGFTQVSATLFCLTLVVHFYESE